MMTVKTFLRNLGLFLLMLKRINGQEGEETLEVNSEGSTANLYRLILYCFISASGCMFLFFCLKIYLEYRYRNRPVVDHGPFGDLRDLCIDELTTEQRKVILDVIFTDENCATFETGTDDIESKNTSSVNQSPTSVMKMFVEEESPHDCTNNKNQLSLQPIPELSSAHAEQDDDGSKRFLKLPPVLKRRPMFFALPTREEFTTNDNVKQEEIKKESEVSIEKKSEENHAKKQKVIDILTDDDIENGVCPICIDCYEPGEPIIKSPHCSHVFHKDCVLQWLEKNFCCPVCRVDMITDEEIVGAIAKVMKEHSGGKESVIQIRSQLSNTTTTAPPSPASSLGSIPQRSPLQVS